MERGMNNGFSVPEIEQAAVSAILQFESARNEAAANLKPEYFHDRRNRLLFEEAIEQWNEGKKIELILFTQHLRDKGILESVGGVFYVTSTYANTCHSPAAMEFYIDRLLAEHERRKCVITCSETVRAAESNPEILSETITALSEIPVRRLKERSFTESVHDKLERMQSGEPDADVIRTGLERLDDQSPLRRGDMPLIVGQRKAGKSILALTIVENVAEAGTPCLYFSLEDKDPKVIDRIFAGVSRIPMTQNHVRKMSDLQIRQATIAAEKVSRLPITIRDDVYDLAGIIAVSRQMNAQGRAGLIVVDYAQLVRCEGKERRLEIEKVSRDLRLLAMELNTPLILLCQLNKEGETRETKALEMDATAAWQLDEDEDDPNKRLLRVPWQRNGESGIMFPVTFLGNIARVENYVREAREQAA